MRYLQNLHTHTSYCDGKQTPRQVVEGAIAKGFASIGFSGHSYMPYSSAWSMSQEGTEDYRRDVLALKQEYADRIAIYCGLECDMFAGVDTSRWEYTIGSVHFVEIDGKYVEFDVSLPLFRDVYKSYFHNNFLTFAQSYYHAVSLLPQYGKFDIIGHFDILTKHIDSLSDMDDTLPEYLDMAFSTARALQGKISYIEVNTGAIARGYRKTPYPSIPILMELGRLGFGAVVTSDCHDVAMLDCAYDDAFALLERCGFSYYHVLTDNGFKALPLAGSCCGYPAL